MDNDDLLIVLPEERDTTCLKQSKISYAREFLLSLSELEVCKRLPKGFDKTLLSEFEDASPFFKDRSRISGSLPLHGFRHNDYGSSPPGKEENFSRGLHRWDSRSSGRSDTDSQSDRDSDSGRRYSNPYRRPWHTSEHDGLLGSGSYPRPPGYGPGTSVPRFRGNDQYQLSRSNDPYHPPRPYKALPHSRREINDSYNDETFGSAECTSDDRVEEERKRRAEFEMMRKEQHKELQEKLKLKSVDKLKDDPLSELAGSLDTRDAKMPNGLIDPEMKQIQQNDSSKISVSSQSQPSRPLVPPGFANIAAEKISATKSVSHADPVQVEMPEVGNINQEEISSLQLGLCENHSEVTSSLPSKGGRKVDLSSAYESLQGSVPDDQSFEALNDADICRITGNGEDMGIESGNIRRHKIMGEAGRSKSILEQLFGGTLSVDSGNASNNVEDPNMKTDDDVWNPKDFGSSKFAHLFLEEEKKQMEDRYSEKSNELLSLIVGERSGPVASETKTMQQIPLESNLVKMVSSPKSTDSGISEPLLSKNKPEAISAVLTCEDLEQSILSKIGEISSISQLPGGISSLDAAQTEKPNCDVNNIASQHLLSLLQRGISPNSKTMSPLSMLDKASPKTYRDSESGRIVEFQDNVKDASAENINRSGKELTLETLFGTDFMKELQSLDAPVSAKMNSAGAESIDASENSKPPFAVADDDVLSASINEIRSQRPNHDDGILRLGGAHQTNLEKVGTSWLSFDKLQTEVESLKLPSELEPKLGAFDGPIDVRLPEEDSLINLNDPVNPQSSIFTANLGVTNAEMFPSSSNAPINIAEKLAALAPSVKDERPIARRQDGPTFHHGPYNMVKPEDPYTKMHCYSSPQFNPTPMNHGRPTFHPLDSHSPHIDPQLKFMPPEGVIHHEGPSHCRFPENMGHSPYLHPNNALPEFDHPIDPMLHDMRMSNHLPPPHLHHGFPGGAPPRPHNSINPPGYIQEHNPIQGLPFGQWQPNIGMPLRGPELGGINSSPPDAFKRLLEMELGSNPKPMHPSFPADGGHSRPVYGHELDTGFWYR